MVDLDALKAELKAIGRPAMREGELPIATCKGLTVFGEDEDEWFWVFETGELNVADQYWPGPEWWAALDVIRRHIHPESNPEV